jgi:dTDP-glucose 4,6-dehydratase
MKRALVAGGAGFIGSHLCEFLISKNYHVICLDNLVTGQKKNVDHLKENFTYLEADITDLPQINDKIDEIYNMASPASPVDFDKLSLEIMNTGSQGQLNLLNLAKDNNSRILFASTSEVYGDPLEHPQKEEYFGNVNTIGIRSVYDEAKRYGEAVSMAHHRRHGTQIRLARIFNTFGPRMRLDDGRIIPNFFTQALNKESLTVYGDGSQTRSFCYVDDLVEGIFALMQSDFIYPTNIGTQLERTVVDMADEINKLVGNSAPHKFLPLPQNDPKLRCPDTTRAKEKLGWEPKTSLEDGLQKTLEFFRAAV